ncbi:Histone-lysine N-methyltransferase ehmt2 [Rhizoclosmatium hyalinum]|nr:Histone-lysine N-methyltransferase ehmt2 [Rhizoclosmatium hyalinum]
MRSRTSSANKDKDKSKDIDGDAQSIASVSSAASSSSSSTNGGMGIGLSFLNIRKRIGSKDEPPPSSSATASLSGVPSNKKLFARASAAAASNANANADIGDSTASPASPASVAHSRSLSARSKASNASASAASGPLLSTALSPSLLTNSTGPRRSFADFRLADTRQQKQRRCLFALQKLLIKYRQENVQIGVSATLSHQKKPFKEPKFKDDKRLAFGKLGGLLQKKRRRRSRTEIFHLINLAIIDQSPAYACQLLDDLSSSALRKKFPLHANRAFYSALGQCMEPLCLSMLEKGFPISVNAPIIIKGSANLWKYGPRESTTGNVVSKFKRISQASATAANSKNLAPPSQDGSQTSPSIHLPSYFMAAVGLGLENVVRGMVKRADVNQNWHGLTPLHITACKNLIGLTQFLLDAGADPSIGILVSQYALLRKLKSINANNVTNISPALKLQQPSQTNTSTNIPVSATSSFNATAAGAGTAPSITNTSPTPNVQSSANSISSASNTPSLSIATTATATAAPVSSSTTALGSTLTATNVSASNRSRSPSPSGDSATPANNSLSSNVSERSRASSLSAATGVSFVENNLKTMGPSTTATGTTTTAAAAGTTQSTTLGPPGAILKKQSSGGTSIRSANRSMNRDASRGDPSTPTKPQTGYVFYPQAGSTDKGLFNNEAEKRRSSVFHMWNDDFMKDRVIFPVELAAACGNCDLARLLLCSFALLVQRDVDLTLLFLRAGVPATQKDAYGSTALHLAARAGHLELVTALIETGKFDVNSKGQNEWTPLHESVCLRRVDVSKYLIRAGANLEAITNSNENVKALATRLGVPKAELDDILATATSPVTASSFNDSSAAASPDSATSPGSGPVNKNIAGVTTGLETKTSSIGRLNLLDIMKRPKSGVSAIGSGSGTGSEKMGSFPSLTNKVGNAGKGIPAKDEAASSDNILPQK